MKLDSLLRITATNFLHSEYLDPCLALDPFKNIREVRLPFLKPFVLEALRRKERRVNINVV